MKISNFILKLKKDIDYRQKYIIFISLICSFLFAFYNGIVGFINHSLWHESIFIYYVLLLFIKLIIFKQLKNNHINSNKKIKNAFILTSILLFILNLALFTPVILMIFNQRTVYFSMIFSIAIATYTTYKITISIINFVKYKKNDNLMIREIKTIQLIEAIVSILTLQNTLIAVNSSGFDKKLFILTIISSVVGLIFILYLIINMIIKSFKH